MRVIDADALIKGIDELKAEADLCEHNGVREIRKEELTKLLAKIPSMLRLDATMVVRCGGCRYKNLCERYGLGMGSDEAYCSEGERMDGEVNGKG